MKFYRADIFTGVFIFFGLLLGLSTILFIYGYNLLDDRNKYTIRMNSLAGVSKGTPIKLKNFSVGEITEVIPIYGTDIYFKAKALINKDLQLYRGTRINITKANVIGDTVIELYPSKVKKYPIREGGTLFATNIVNLDQMVTEISNMISNAGDMVETVSNVAGDSSREIKMLLRNLNGTVARVNYLLGGTQEEIIATMRNIRKTSVTLERFSREMAANPWKILEKKGDSNQTALP